ncbi:hypothetical protein cypCar_00035622 [Cyprinus carpio]|nr:hypothetical protein cypCar_00035622 [Cyprinus carpio]
MLLLCKVKGDPTGCRFEPTAIGASVGCTKHLCPSEMKFICLTLLIMCGITDSRSEQYDVVGPVDPVFAVAGEDVILPCSVKPSISVVDMRVEWFRSELKDSQLVHLYENHEDRNTEQIQSYRERTKLNHQELQRGDASLKLSSVQISDEGRYKCFIQSESWYNDATVDVSVEDKRFNPWRTSIILISAVVLLIVIAGMLMAAFIQKNRSNILICLFIYYI